MDKKVAIITDSASNISNEDAEKYNIKIIPLRICFSDKTYLDRFDISWQEFYEKLEHEIPKTSLPSVKSILDVLDSLKNENYTDVIYIGMSSGLSGTYNFVDTIGREYDGLNFISVDTKTLSCGQGALVIAAAKELIKSKCIDKVVSIINEIRKKMTALFVLEDLTYLKKGGRIGKVAGSVGSMLHISPIITVNNDGVYETAAKSIGFKKAKDTLIKELKKRYEGSKVALSIVVGKGTDKTDDVITSIKSFCKIDSIMINVVTPVLGAHTGPGLLGIVAYNV